MNQCEKRVLVVGTTQDYIDHIRLKMPKRAVFITDPDAYTCNEDTTIFGDDELVYPLRNEKKVLSKLKEFLRRKKVVLTGVACFDCESLLMASAIAHAWKLPFVSRQSVLSCRNKYLSKKRWIENKIPCPRVCEVYSFDNIISFMHAIGGSIVLKSARGSGSELIFVISSLSEALRAYETILERLEARSHHRLYTFNQNRGNADIVCEEFIAGDEFSCDVYYDRGRLEILRIAKKYFFKELPIGTTVAYEVPGELPSDHGESILKRYLVKALRAVRITRGLCMVDFIWHEGIPYLLELSPRPGGDCLPALIEQCCGVDMLGLTLDFAEGQPIKMPPKSSWERLICVRFYAEYPGWLKSIRPRLPEWQENTRKIIWLRKPGNEIKLPPEDYDSWLLGYGIFSPKEGIPIKNQLHKIARSIVAEIA